MVEEDLRLYLHEKLEETFPDMEAYYRPPGDLMLTRPCMIYEALEEEPTFANNSLFTTSMRYEVMMLSDLPGIRDKRPMFGIPRVTVQSNNSYVSDDVVHDVFIVIVK